LDLTADASAPLLLHLQNPRAA